MYTRDEIIELNRKAIIDDDQFKMAKLVRPFRGLRLDVLDIGANVGWFAIKLLQHWQQAQVYCFEPIPTNVNQIPHDDRIQVIHAAVDVDVGTRTMYRHTGTTYKSQDNDQLWSFLKNFKGRITATQDCYCLSFRNVLQASSAIAIVKLDVEGYEAELLDSITPIDIQHVSVFVVEDHVNYFPSHPNHVLLRAGMRLWYNVPGNLIFTRL